MKPDIVIVDGHEFHQETVGLRGDDPADPSSLVVFRWACSCGGRGQPQHRRKELMRLWMGHVERHGPIEEKMA